MRDGGREARWWTRDGNRIVCELCPHRCRIAEGQAGRCGVRQNQDGTLISLTDGRYLTGHLDPIEKKPLARFRPGTWIYSVGTAGCNLSCDFCQNWELVHMPLDRPGTRFLSDDYILAEAAREPSSGIAFTYNEPLMNYENLLRLSQSAKVRGLETVVVTNGYLNPEPMQELCPFIDAWNIDLKGIRDDYYRRLCGGHVAPVLESIRLADATGHVEVTCLLIEGENTADDDIRDLALAVAAINRSIPLHLSRYFPAHLRKDPPTPLPTMFRAREICAKILEYVYLGNV